MTTVLITGAGAPGIAGTIYSVRENPDKKPFRIISTDISANPVGRFLSDAFYVLPKPESSIYLEALKDIVRKEKVDVIIPQTTREIDLLSKHRNSLNCKVIVSGGENIARANDKYLIIKECEKTGVPFPKYFLVTDTKSLKDAIYSIGYPEKKAIVKPRMSNGLRGVRIITEQILTLKSYLGDKPSGLEIDLNTFMKIFEGAETFPELLVTEYMPGEEYSVDVFRTQKQKVIIPRLRKSIRSGISFETVVDLQRKDVIEHSQKLAESLDLNYCFGFQFKLDDNDVPKILESNPRVQGTMIAAAAAGCNMIYYSVLEALNPGGIYQINLKDKVEFKRYWGGVGIDQQNNVIIESI